MKCQEWQRAEQNAENGYRKKNHGNIYLVVEQRIEKDKKE